MKNYFRSILEYDGFEKAQSQNETLVWAATRVKASKSNIWNIKFGAWSCLFYGTAMPAQVYKLARQFRLATFWCWWQNFKDLEAKIKMVEFRKRGIDKLTGNSGLDNIFANYADKNWWWSHTRWVIIYDSYMRLNWNDLLHEINIWRQTWSELDGHGQEFGGHGLDFGPKSMSESASLWFRICI